MKSVIFDFDGVIAESVDVKTKAFRELFAEDHPEIMDEVEKFHLENGGMSRYEKIRYFYRDLLKLELTDEKFEELCDLFHRLVVDKVVEAPYVPGAEDVLELCAERDYLMYIVSGTPEGEMKEIVVLTLAGECVRKTICQLAQKAAPFGFVSRKPRGRLLPGHHIAPGRVSGHLVRAVHVSLLYLRGASNGHVS